MLKKVFFYLAFLCFFVSPAMAWDQTFESHDYDLAMSSFTLNGVNLVTSQGHGICLSVTGTSGESSNVIIKVPYTGYFALSCYAPGGSGMVKFYAYDSSGSQLISITASSTGSSSYWHRLEFIENAEGTGIDVYSDGVLQTSGLYLSSNTPASFKLTAYAPSGSMGGYWDDFTTSSSHAVIGIDSSAVVTDAGEYYRIGVPFVSGKSYQIRVYSPNNQVVYVQNFTDSNTLLTERLIPVANLTTVGEYTLHLYRVNSGSSKTFLTMKSFTVSDPAATNEGSITLSKLDYETGDSVDFWVHLNEYSSGYKVKCDFVAGGGSNFKKEVSVNDETFHGSFSIPDISNVIGSQTVYLLNPDGQVVDSEDFNVYVPGLPDIAFDKSTYERSDKALIYYKDVKDDSTLTVTLRYGGSNAETLTFNIEGNGAVTLDLSSLSAADSILAVVKDSDGYFNDDDNAKIIVGNFIITGRVYDAKTSSVIPGATVTVQGNAINSDTDGNYNLTAVAGFANYSVVATGYNSINGTVAVFDLETIHNFYLSPILTNAGTGVYGTVVSAKTDYPLVGAAVEVTSSDNLKRFSTIVDNRGFYSISNDDLAGNLSIRVSSNNYDSIVATATVTSGTMQNHNFRLNAVPGYTEIDPSEHTGGQDSSNPGKTAEEIAYEEKYGEMGKHPFDFNGDGQVENSEWKYAFERLGLLLGCLAFMGFMLIIGRRR